MLKFILDFFKIFSWNKSFQRNVWLGNVWLNKLGLHVLRVLIAHAFFRFRLFQLAIMGLISHAERKHFINNGFLVYEHFLTDEVFSQLKQELLNYDDQIRDVIEGSTLTQRVYLDTQKLKQLPNCEALVQHGRLRKIVRYCSSKNRLPLYYIENIKQHFFSSSKPDPQKDLHADTFHPTVKAWLFIDEVSIENGAFTYVPGANRLTFRRLIWEYQESVQAAKNKHDPNMDRYWDGSFGISHERLTQLGYPAPQAMMVLANTLLVANTFAFHCRGNAKGKKSRMAIWMQMRDNPFNPLLTPLPTLAYHLNEKVWQYLMRKRDAELSKNGELITKKAKFER